MDDEPQPLLQLGNRVVLEPSAGPKRPGIPGTLVQVEGLALTLTVDPNAALKDGVATGMEWTVRGDARYRVRGDLQAVDRGRWRLKVTDGPHRLQERSDFRVRVFQVAVCARLGDGMAVPGKVVNISAGGVELEVDTTLCDLLPIGTQFACDFELPGDGGFCSTPAEVVRESDRNKVKTRLGARFVNIDHEDHARIARWVFAEQVQRTRV